MYLSAFGSTCNLPFGVLKWNLRCSSDRGPATLIESSVPAACSWIYFECNSGSSGLEMFSHTYVQACVECEAHFTHLNPNNPPPIFEPFSYPP